MTEEYIVCNYQHQPGCICGRTIRELQEQVARMQPVVNAAIGCWDTFRNELIDRSPYPGESRNNKAFDVAIRTYKEEQKKMGKLNIMLNGRVKEVDSDTVSFEYLRKLAGIPFADTVTYSRAVSPEEGTLTMGCWVTVKEGTVVNVANTSGA